MTSDQVTRYSDVAELGAALLAARRGLRLTQRHVAIAAGVTERWLHTIEQGKVQGADTTRLLAVAKAVGLGFALVPLTGLTGPQE